MDLQHQEHEEGEGEGERAQQNYLEFIAVTRKHQAERERAKKLELKKNPPIEEYYIDVSQVNTLVIDNLVEAPSKNDDSAKLNSNKEKKLIEYYGSKESYERIRSLEMNIDDNFKKKCRELSPYYWPVIPINPKPYLNPIRK